MESVQNLTSFWRSSQNYFVLALFCSLLNQQPFLMYLAVEKHRIICLTTVGIEPTHRGQAYFSSLPGVDIHSE
jgi:hypothetical protein